MTLKPIFLHFANRELYKGAGIKPDTVKIYHWLESLCITQKTYLVCNIAQLYEFFYEDLPILNLLQCLQESGFLITLSQMPNFQDFLENRRDIYNFDIDRYPMYFDKEVVNSLPKIGFSQRTHIDTTLSLQSRIAAFNPEDLFATSGILSRADQNKILPYIGKIQRITENRDGRAITSSLFRNSLGLQKYSSTDLLISRLMSGSYVGHYAHILDAIVPSGANGIENSEIENGFPRVDLKILQHFLQLSGFYNQKFRKSNKYLFDLNSFIRSFLHIHLSDELQNLIDKFYEEFITSFNSTISFQYKNPIYQNSARIHIMNSLSRRIKNPPQSKTIVEHINRVYDILLTSSRTSIQPGIISDLFGHVPTVEDKKRMKKILLQTANDTEDQALYDELRSRNIESRPLSMSNAVVTTFSFRDLTIYHVRTAMGQSGPGSSQVIIPSIVNSLDIDAVIAVGICFGLDNNNQNLGDIIFSSAIIDYESEKTTEAGTQSRGERIHMQAKIIAFCQIPTRQALPYKVLSGVYISGYKLVNNPEMVSALKNKFPDAKAGDMESYAVLNAARSSDVQMICIKGICDWGYNKDDSSQETAAHNAMNYLFKVLDTISNAQNNTITT